MEERSEQHGMRESEGHSPPRMRLDRWLKAARLFKTRTCAKKACEDGLVKIAKKRVKPSRQVGVGDTISVTRKGRVTFYEVRGLSERSLPAHEAAGLYCEKQTVEQPGTRIMKLIREAEGVRGPGARKGRPTKKERRMITKLRDR
jgi:ribosome-associated heat shock protein Hsp15